MCVRERERERERARARARESITHVYIMYIYACILHMQGTFLMLPVPYHVLNRTRHARESGEDEDPEDEDEDDEHHDLELEQSGSLGGSHAVLRKRHAGDGGALRYGRMAVLAGAQKEVLGARVVINCLDARHMGRVWGYHLSTDKYLIKLDHAVGPLGEIMEAGEVYSPIPCEHVMVVDRSFDELPLEVVVRRVLPAEERRTVRSLPPWRVVLTEKNRRGPCVMAELLDDPHRLDDERDDFDKGAKGDKEDRGAGGGRKRGRGRGRPALVDGAGSGSAEIERAEDPLVFCPRFKYEGSGRLLDMAPHAELEDEGAEFSAGAVGLKDLRAQLLYRIIRAGGDDSIDCRCLQGAEEDGADDVASWEVEQSCLWHEIREELYQSRMQQLQLGNLSLTGDISVAQHLDFYVKESKHSAAKRQRVAAVLDRAAQGLDRSNMLALSFSLLKTALDMDVENDSAAGAAGGCGGMHEAAGGQRLAIARLFMGLFFDSSSAARGIEAACTKHPAATSTPSTRTTAAASVPTCSTPDSSAAQPASRNGNAIAERNTFDVRSGFWPHAPVAVLSGADGGRQASSLEGHTSSWGVTPCSGVGKTSEGAGQTSFGVPTAPTPLSDLRLPASSRSSEIATGLSFEAEWGHSSLGAQPSFGGEHFLLGSSFGGQAPGPPLEVKRHLQNVAASAGHTHIPYTREAWQQTRNWQQGAANAVHMSQDNAPKLTFAAAGSSGAAGMPVGAGVLEQAPFMAAGMAGGGDNAHTITMGSTLECPLGSGQPNSFGSGRMHLAASHQHLYLTNYNTNYNTNGLPHGPQALDQMASCDAHSISAASDGGGKRRKLTAVLLATPMDHAPQTSATATSQILQGAPASDMSRFQAHTASMSHSDGQGVAGHCRVHGTSGVVLNGSVSGVGPGFSYTSSEWSPPPEA